jgi:hypothetical protein
MKPDAMNTAYRTSTDSSPVHVAFYPFIQPTIDFSLRESPLWVPDEFNLSSYILSI